MRLFARCARYDQPETRCRTPSIPRDLAKALKWCLNDVRCRIQGADGITYAKHLVTEQELLAQLAELERKRRDSEAKRVRPENLSPEEQRECVKEQFSKLPDGLLLPILEIRLERGFEVKGVGG